MSLNKGKGRIANQETTPVPMTFPEEWDMELPYEGSDGEYESFPPASLMQAPNNGESSAMGGVEEEYDAFARASPTQPPNDGESSAMCGIDEEGESSAMRGVDEEYDPFAPFERASPTQPPNDGGSSAMCGVDEEYDPFVPFAPFARASTTQPLNDGQSSAMCGVDEEGESSAMRGVDKEYDPFAPFERASPTQPPNDGGSSAMCGVDKEYDPFPPSALSQASSSPLTTPPNSPPPAPQQPLPVFNFGTSAVPSYPTGAAFINAVTASVPTTFQGATIPNSFQGTKVSYTPQSATISDAHLPDYTPSQRTDFVRRSINYYRDEVPDEDEVMPTGLDALPPPNRRVLPMKKNRIRPRANAEPPAAKAPSPRAPSPARQNLSASDSPSPETPIRTTFPHPEHLLLAQAENQAMHDTMMSISKDLAREQMILAAKEEELIAVAEDRDAKVEELKLKDLYLRSNVLALTSKHQELTFKDQELDFKVQELTAKGQELAAKEQEWKKMMNQREEECDKLQRQLQLVSEGQELSAKEQEWNRMKNQLVEEREKLQRQLVSDGQEREKLQRQLVSDGQEHEKLQRQLMSDGQEHEKLQRQLVSDGQEHEKLQRQLVSDGQEWNRMKDQLVEDHEEMLRQVKQSLTENMIAMREAGTFLEQRVETLESQQAELLVELNRSQEKLDKERALGVRNVEVHTKRIADLNASLHQTKLEQSESYEKSRAGLQEEIQNKIEIIRAKDQAIEQMSTIEKPGIDLPKHEELQKKYDDLEVDHEKLRGKYAEFEKETSEQTMTIRELRNDINSKDQTISDFESKIEFSKTEIQKRNDAIAAKTAELRSRASAFADANKELLLLRGENEKLIKSKKALADEKSRSEQGNKALQRKIVEFEPIIRERNRLQRRLGEANTDNIRLVAEGEELERQISELTAGSAETPKSKEEFRAGEIKPLSDELASFSPNALSEEHASVSPSSLSEGNTSFSLNDEKDFILQLQAETRASNNPTAYQPKSGAYGIEEKGIEVEPEVAEIKSGVSEPKGKGLEVVSEAKPEVAQIKSGVSEPKEKGLEVVSEAKPEVAQIKSGVSEPKEKGPEVVPESKPEVAEIRSGVPESKDEGLEVAPEPKTEVAGTKSDTSEEKEKGLEAKPETAGISFGIFGALMKRFKAMYEAPGIKSDAPKSTSESDPTKGTIAKAVSEPFDVPSPVLSPVSSPVSSSAKVEASDGKSDSSGSTITPRRMAEILKAGREKARNSGYFETRYAPSHFSASAKTHNPIACWMQVYIDLWTLFVFWMAHSSFVSLVRPLFNIKGQKKRVSFAETPLTGQEANILKGLGISGAEEAISTDTDAATSISPSISPSTDTSDIPPLWLNLGFLAIHLMFYIFVGICISNYLSVLAERTIWLAANETTRRQFLVLFSRRAGSRPQYGLVHWLAGEARWLDVWRFNIDLLAKVNRSPPG